MSGIKISALPSAALPLSGNEVLPIVQSGDTVQVATKNVYAGSSGSSQMGFIAAGTGATARTVQIKLRDIISVKDFGATGDGTTDDTAAVQAAITAAAASAAQFRVYFPSGTYRLTAALNVTAAVSLVGAGVSPYNAALGAKGYGTWLYFDHTGKGINIDGPSVLSGIELTNFGTYRNQPAPAVGWAPNAHNYDIYIDNADVLINDLMLLNPTKGVFLTNGSYGRLEINTLRGQAFQTMVRIDTAYDVVKINNLHQWPFWQDNADVHAYTEQNLDALYFERSDNPMLVNIFTIFARAGIRFGKSATGATSKMHAVNCDFDRGLYGIWVDNTVTAGITGQFANITCQGETSLVGSKGLFVQSDSSTLVFDNFDSGYSWQNAVRVEGTGNRVTFGAARANLYDQQAAGFPAYEALNGNTLVFAVVPLALNGGGPAIQFSATGTIVCDKWRIFTPTVTSGTGTLTSVTATGLYKVVGNTVSVEFSITITNNGTGGGDIRFTAPFSTATAAFTGSGRETAIAGKQLSVYAPASSTIYVYNYDNSYPASTGAVLTGTIQYSINI